VELEVTRETEILQPLASTDHIDGVTFGVIAPNPNAKMHAKFLRAIHQILIPDSLDRLNWDSNRVGVRVPWVDGGIPTM